MEMFLGIIFGGAIVAFGYEVYYERREKLIQKLLPNKIEELVELTSIRISKKQKQLKRELTEEEKNIILDECYQEI